MLLVEFEGRSGKVSEFRTGPNSVMAISTVRVRYRPVRIGWCIRNNNWNDLRRALRLGVLPRASRTESGYRLYPASAVERVLVVQRALRIGFTLTELAEILKAGDTGGAPCGRVFQLAHEKLKGIEADIEALKCTKRYLKKVLADWEQRIQRAAPGQKSHLLHSLSETLKDSGAPASSFRRKRKS